LAAPLARSRSSSCQILHVEPGPSAEPVSFDATHIVCGLPNCLRGSPSQTAQNSRM